MFLYTSVYKWEVCFTARLQVYIQCCLSTYHWMIPQGKMERRGKAIYWTFKLTRKHKIKLLHQTATHLDGGSLLSLKTNPKLQELRYSRYKGGWLVKKLVKAPCSYGLLFVRLWKIARRLQSSRSWSRKWLISAAPRSTAHQIPDINLFDKLFLLLTTWELQPLLRLRTENIC